MLPKVHARAPVLKPEKKNTQKPSTSAASIQPKLPVAKGAVPIAPIAPIGKPGTDVRSSSSGNADAGVPVAVPGTIPSTDAPAMSEAPATYSNLEQPSSQASIRDEEPPFASSEMAVEEPLPVEVPLMSGEVKVVYEQYEEMFPVELGTLTHTAIDDVYCLSFVMPGCSLHLSEWSPTEKTRMEQSGEVVPFVAEEPVGVFQRIDIGKVYYVYVEQEADRLIRDQMETKQRLASAGAGTVAMGKNSTHQEYYENCSCMFGNPCVDEYACKDWHNRHAIATKNGWKGF